jgi:hypothetical protein
MENGGTDMIVRSKADRWKHVLRVARSTYKELNRRFGEGTTTIRDAVLGADDAVMEWEQG